MKLKKAFPTFALSLALSCSAIAPYAVFAAPPTSNAQVSVDKSAPTSPLNLNAYATTYKSVSLIWDKSTDNNGIAAYDVYVNGKLAGSSAANEYGIAMTNLTVKDLKPNTMYSFKVVARDAAGNHSNESAHVNVRTDVLGQVFNVKDFGAKGERNLCQWIAPFSGRTHPTKEEGQRRPRANGGRGEEERHTSGSTRRELFRCGHPPACASLERWRL